MNHPFTKGLTASTLALALAVGSPALAHGGPDGGRGRGGFGDAARVLHALDLSADQKQQIRDIVSQHRATMAPLLRTQRQAEQAIADRLFSTSTVSQGDLDGLAQQAMQAKTAVAQERLAIALAVRNVLTPAQMTKAASIHDGLKQLHTQARQLLGNTSD